MTTQSNHSLIPSKFFSQLCGLIAAGLGGIAIVGWLMGWRILTNIRSDYIPMAPNTALSFIVLGISLCALITGRKRGLKLSRIGAAVIFVLSLIRFTEISVNINLNVDRWIFQVPSEKLGLIPVGRMALPTALNFLFASAALFLASSLKRRWSADALTRVLAGLTTFIGLAFCLGYIYGAPLLYGGTTIPMALNTAISFFVLGLGLVINNASHDTAERKRAAEALRKAHDELEVRVAARTAELAKANEALRAEIIERKRAEEALRKSEERFRKLVESVTNYIYTVEIKDGKPVSTKHGPGCVAVTGYTSEEYEADPHLWYRMIHEGDREAVIEQADKALSGEAVQSLEHRITSKDGSIRWVRNTPVPQHGEQGRVDGLITDITEHKKLEDQLRQSQKMEAIGQLASGIAHDFNNILTAIIGYGTLLLKKTRDDNPAKEYAGEIINSANRAAALTRDLLTFNRKHTINPQPALLNELIKMVEKILARVIGEQIELKVILTDRNLVVKMDVNQIEQVLLNLAANARDAMPEGGKLTIDVSHVKLDNEFIDAHNYGIQGQYALITFTDTGIGMDKNIQSRIFEPFFTTKEVGKGTGLGLSMAYGAIKQHNGYINVYSEPGHGTVFKIYLPLSEDGVLGEKKEPEIAALKGNMETILVAEDGPDTRRTIKAVLEEYNYRVIEAVDGSDAISKFMEKKDEISLLILDTIMPRVNGKQAYEGIKNIDPNIKAIFISGYTADMIKAKDLLETGIELLPKPIAPDKLLAKIREMIDLKGGLTE